METHVRRQPPPPRQIADTWIVYFGPYEGRSYGDVKKLHPEYAINLTYLLAGKSFDIYFYNIEKN